MYSRVSHRKVTLFYITKQSHISASHFKSFSGLLLPLCCDKQEVTTRLQCRCHPVARMIMILLTPLRIVDMFLRSPSLTPIVHLFVSHLHSSAFCVMSSQMLHLPFFKVYKMSSTACLPPSCLSKLTFLHKMTPIISLYLNKAVPLLPVYGTH